MKTLRRVLPLLLLAGCAVGPDYKRPDVETPNAYKEAEGWKQAEPSDQSLRGSWWETYGDAQLNTLVQQVAVSNQKRGSGVNWNGRPVRP